MTLAVSQRPQRYRRPLQRTERDGDAELTAALEQSRRTASDSKVRVSSDVSATDAKSLRRQLQSTLSAMAAAPLEIRKRQRQAATLASRCGDEDMWVAFCSVRTFASPRGRSSKGQLWVLFPRTPPLTYPMD